MRSHFTNSLIPMSYQLSEPLSIDLNQKENYKQLVPRKQTLTSHDAGWQNIVFEYHRQPAYEMPEVQFQQHTIVVNLKNTPSEHRMDARFLAKNAQRGDILLVPAEVDFWTADRTDSEFIVLAIELQQLHKSCRELFEGNTVELIPTFPQSDPFIYGTALALKQELETNYGGCRLYAESLFNSLCAHLVQRYSMIEPHIKEYQDGLAPYKLKRVIELIGDRIGEDVTIEQMANCIDLSSAHFARKFKRSMGLTPHQYVVKQRIERVKQLLKEQKLSLSAIAFECGFTHQSHMGRIFKEQVGTTPKRYRNEFK